MNDVDPRLAIVKIWNAVAARDSQVPPVIICRIGEFERETNTICKERKDVGYRQIVSVQKNRPCFSLTTAIESIATIIAETLYSRRFPVSSSPMSLNADLSNFMALRRLEVSSDARNFWAS